MEHKRPPGVTFLATLLVVYGTALFGIGLVTVLVPGDQTLFRWLGFPRDLQRFGQFVALASGATWIAVGSGLFMMRQFGRLAAMTLIIMGAGIEFSRIVVAAHFDRSLVLWSLEILGRLVIVWYLFRASTADKFMSPAKTNH